MRTGVIDSRMPGLKKYNFKAVSVGLDRGHMKHTVHSGPSVTNCTSLFESWELWGGERREQRFLRGWPSFLLPHFSQSSHRWESPDVTVATTGNLLSLLTLCTQCSQQLQTERQQ